MASVRAALVLAVSANPDVDRGLAATQRVAALRRAAMGGAQLSRTAPLSTRRCRCQAVATSAFNPADVDVSQVKPQGDRLLVKLDDVAKTSAGGVLLPSSAVKYEAQLTGQIVSAGPEVTSAQPGQKVMFTDLNAYEVSLGGGKAKLCFVKEGDLLAIVE